MGSESEFDYINKHMGGHDEDGLPNFMKQIEADYRKERMGSHNKDPFTQDEEVLVNDDIESTMNKDKTSYILENLLERIDLEVGTLTITKTELNALSYALEFIKREEIIDKNPIDTDCDDDIPF